MHPYHLLQVEVRGFLFALAGIIAYKLLTRRISMAGLLRSDEQGAISTERVQLLLATIALSSRYFGQVTNSSSGSLPDVGNDWLYMFGGSSAIYVAMKVFKTFNK